jgi:predicted DNA-binding transcriptional regulator YafY
VRIRFQPQVVRYLEERRWHSSEKLERQPDGTLIAEFQLTSFGEVKSWVLSFGSQAEILAPQSWKDEIAATIRAMNQIYSNATEPPLVPEKKRRTL